MIVAFLVFRPFSVVFFLPTLTRYISEMTQPISSWHRGHVYLACDSLRKHPFLLALRRWGRFARRNVCDSAAEIPY